MGECRVNLDKRLRRTNEVLNVSFTCTQVAHTCDRRGNRSVPRSDPAQAALLLLDNIKSERDLLRIIPKRPDHLWILDYCPCDISLHKADELQV